MPEHARVNRVARLVLRLRKVWFDLPLSDQTWQKGDDVLYAMQKKATR